MAGYEQFRSMAEVLNVYRRARTPKVFIIRSGGWNPPCERCGRCIFDFSGKDESGKPLHPEGYQSNRCTYYPKTKKVKALHYTCAWGDALDIITRVKVES